MDDDKGTYTNYDSVRNSVLVGTAAMIIFGSCGYQCIPINIQGHPVDHFAQKPWEKALKSFDSSGGEIFKNTDDYAFSVLSKFASNLLSNMEDTPKEYDSIFQQIYRDILA